ncbi:DUF5067 domain-containing protein [Schaalia georgiae]|nr:DUF5067 domain-containing protein [Schaalia georgiae]
MSTVPPSAGGPTPLGPSQDPWSVNQNPGASQQDAPGASPLPYFDQPTSALPSASAPYQGDGILDSPQQDGYPPQSGPGAQLNGYASTAQQGGYGAPDYDQGAPYGQSGSGSKGPDDSLAVKQNRVVIGIVVIAAIAIAARVGLAVCLSAFSGSSDPTTESAPAGPGLPSADGGSPSATPTSSDGGSPNGGSASQGQPGNMTLDASGVETSVDGVGRGPKDNSGQDTVIVTLTTTNNTSSAQSAVAAIPKAFSGREAKDENALLPAVFPVGSEPNGVGFEEDDEQTVQPGKSVTWELAYTLPQTTDEITIQLISTDGSTAGPWTLELPK